MGRIHWNRIALVFLLTVILAKPVNAREITDMAGRRVTVPESITKVYGASPPATYLIYAIDPAVIVRLNFSFNDMEKPFLARDVVNLPVIGGWFGQGRTPNQETLLKVKPDVMIAWMWKQAAANEKLEQTAQQLGIPLVYVKIDSLYEYPEAFQFVASLLSHEKRGRLLSEFATLTLKTIQSIVSAIPDREKITVYYAEAPDGLSTECDKSSHTELIKLAGGKNIYQCAPKNDFGTERISIEQVLLADPEVIVAQEKEFLSQVYRDPKWQSIRAVKNKRVYLIPKAPFNWFDRPPSFMRLLGIKWLTNIFYPDRYPLNLPRETKEFYRLFLGVELNDKALQEVLQQ